MTIIIPDPSGDPDDERRVTVEDVLGEFGFRLVWSVRDHWADVTAYEIVSREEERPLFRCADWERLPTDETTSHEAAEIYLSGYIKWDGCTELAQGQPHWCGPLDYKKHCDLLRYIYYRAMELMGALPESWGDGEGIVDWLKRIGLGEPSEAEKAADLEYNVSAIESEKEQKREANRTK